MLILVHPGTIEMTSEAVQREVSDFREQIKKDAEDLVLRQFPQHMLDLNKLLTVNCATLITFPILMPVLMF